MTRRTAAPYRKKEESTHVGIHFEPTLLLQALGELPGLIDPDLVDLLLDLLPRPLLEILLLSLLRSFGSDPRPLGLGDSLLGGSSGVELLHELLPPSDDRSSSGGRALVGLSLGDGLLEKGSLRLLGGESNGGVDVLDGGVEEGREPGELGSDEVGGRGLKVSDGDDVRERGR